MASFWWYLKQRDHISRVGHVALVGAKIVEYFQTEILGSVNAKRTRQVAAAGRTFFRL